MGTSLLRLLGSRREENDDDDDKSLTQQAAGREGLVRAWPRRCRRNLSMKAGGRGPDVVISWSKQSRKVALTGLERGPIKVSGNKRRR